MAEPVVLTERIGAALLVTINRPERRNAIDADAAEVLNDALTPRSRLMTTPA